MLNVLIKSIKAILYILAVAVSTFLLMLMISVSLNEMQPIITTTALLLILAIMLAWEFKDIDLLSRFEEFMKKY